MYAILLIGNEVDYELERYHSLHVFLKPNCASSKAILGGESVAVALIAS